MALLPYSRQQVTERDIDAVVAVLRSPLLTQGPTVPAFETAVAQRLGVAHAVAVTSATTALHLACLALGIGPGSRVWTSPNSFVASANCAVYCGAEVDFVDIDPHTRNLSIEALQARLQACARTGTLPDLLIPVDFAGLPCDTQALRALADTWGFRILEDASHALGATLRGTPVGQRWADATVFSFHAVKILTTAEGGMVVTPHADVADRLRSLRNHGVTRDRNRWRQADEGAWWYEQHTLGFNARMTELQAALGLSQLERLDAMQALREALAFRYDQALRGLPVSLPPRFADRDSAWHLYSIGVEPSQRRELYEAMQAAGIGVNVHYIPIPLQPYWQDRGFKPGDFPNAERWYRGALSLPLFPSMQDDELDRVVEVLAHALALQPA